MTVQEVAKLEERVSIPMGSNVKGFDAALCEAWAASGGSF